MNVSNSNITDTGIQMILQTCLNLCTLNADHTGITSQAFTNINETCRLSSLTLNDCPNLNDTLFDLLSKLPRFIQLEISFAKQISGAGLIRFLEKHRYFIQTLYFRSCGKFTDEHIEYIATHCCSNLQS